MHYSSSKKKMRKFLLFLGILSIAMLAAAQDLGDFIPDGVEEFISEAGTL